MRTNFYTTLSQQEHVATTSDTKIEDGRSSTRLDSQSQTVAFQVFPTCKTLMRGRKRKRMETWSSPKFQTFSMERRIITSHNNTDVPVTHWTLWQPKTQKRLPKFQSHSKKYPDPPWGNVKSCATNSRSTHHPENTCMPAGHSKSNLLELCLQSPGETE